MSRKSFHTKINEVIRTIVLVLPKLAFPFTDTERLQHISDGFASFSRGKLTRTVGAIDGLLVRIKKPKHNGMHYFCRKGAPTCTHAQMQH